MKRWARTFEALGGDEISPSLVETYLRCPMQWYWRYIEKKKMPPGVALVQGSSVHTAAGVDLENAIENGTHLGPDVVADIAAAEYDKRVQEEGVMLTPAEESLGRDNVLGAAKDQTVAMAVTYGKKSEVIVPKQVEVWLVGSLKVDDDELKIVGRPDAIVQKMAADEEVSEADAQPADRDGQVVMDLKTTGAKWPKTRLINSLQMRVYSMLAEKPVEVLQIVKGRGKGQPKSVVAAAAYNKQSYYRAQHLIVRVLDSIEAGIFPPTSPTDWACSPAYCGYWAICPFGGGAKKWV